MKSGPNIAAIAALIGDPARANILTALMSGQALTATELSHEAGVSAQTTSSHLRKLSDGGLIAQRAQGRHRYYALNGDDVAHMLESLMGLAAGRGHLRVRPGPKDTELRHARVCYNHLAGEMGVQMYRALGAQGVIKPGLDTPQLTKSGADFMTDLGIDVDALAPGKSPLCRDCLDWSMRQSHLAGRLGRALLSHMLALGWASRVPDSRVIRFSPSGQAQFDAIFTKVA